MDNFCALLAGVHAASLGRAESREHSPSREHRGNVSYRPGKWECDHGLGLGFRFPVSLPHTFYMRNGFVSEIRAPQKVIMRNRLDMFSEGRVSQKRSRFACKMYGGVRRGIETLTLTQDHIPIYPVYNSRFPCVPAKGCVPDFPLGRG